MTEGNRARILALLTRGTIDLAVMGQPPDDADVIAERFAPHPSIIIAPAGHPLAAAKSLPLNALAAEPFIMREEGSGTKAMTDGLLHTAGFRSIIAMVSSSNETIKQAVIAGMGLALISGHTVSLERALGLVSALPVENFPLMRAWFIVQRRTLPLLPVRVRLRSYFIEQGDTVVEDLMQNHLHVASTSRHKPAHAA